MCELLYGISFRLTTSCWTAGKKTKAVCSQTQHFNIITQSATCFGSSESWQGTFITKVWICKYICKIRLVQHTYWYRTPTGTAHRKLQHTDRYNTPTGTAHRPVQHTDRYSTLTGTAHRTLQHTDRYNAPTGTAHRPVQHTDRYNTPTSKHTDQYNTLFNIQQLYALPTLYLCVLYLSENKQRLVPLTA